MYIVKCIYMLSTTQALQHETMNPLGQQMVHNTLSSILIVSVGFLPDYVFTQNDLGNNCWVKETCTDKDRDKVTSKQRLVVSKRED